MTQRLLSILLLAVLLAGCGGGSYRVCGQFDAPDFCKTTVTTSRTIFVKNACAATIEIASSEPLTRPRAGSATLRSGESATFELPQRQEESVTWAGRIYARDDPQSYAELALLTDDPDRYVVSNRGSESLRMRPVQAPPRTGMYLEVPEAYWCRSAQGEPTLSVCRADHAAANDLDYAVTFCGE